MQTQNRLLDDLARVATSALGVAAGMRAELEARLRDQFERYKQLHPELLRHREAVAIPPAGAAMERLEPRRRPVEVVSPVVDAPVSLTETEPAESNGGTITFTLGMTMQELERAAIAATLAAVNGNRRRASEKLGIGERTLYRKLKEYDIET
ncbi:MAG: hypothetical protein IH805_09995 [Proteobacteria bacterium]|nr:hypothetical protein [Pseudomonadota bacterium]